VSLSEGHSTLYMLNKLQLWYKLFGVPCLARCVPGRGAAQRDTSATVSGVNAMGQISLSSICSRVACMDLGAIFTGSVGITAAWTVIPVQLSRVAITDNQAEFSAGVVQAANSLRMVATSTVDKYRP
jgi:hypothetical protein